MNQEIEIPCEECGHCGGTACIGQSFVSNQLRWYRSISCQDGRHIEEDDIGFPPKHVRQELLKRGGRWKLIVSESNRVAVIIIVRRALGLSMEETAAAFRLFPTVYSGTKTEAKWLKVQMDASNIASQMVLEA